MAQTGFTAIVSYHTETAAAAPAAIDLEVGELAVNVTDLKLYTKDGAGNVVLLGSGPDTPDTLVNKTIALGDNTITGTLAEFNLALTDADFATLAGAETLSNKTLDSSNDAPTAAPGTSTTQLATTAFAQTMTSPGFLGVPTAPTAAPATSTTQIATTAFAQTMTSPGFLGVPTVPTAAPLTGTAQVASTKFVTDAIFAGVTPVGSVGVWISGTSYTPGNVVYSPLTGLTYRCMIALAPSTIDPAIDTANWVGVAPTIPGFVLMSLGVI